MSLLVPALTVTILIPAHWDRPATHSNTRIRSELGSLHRLEVTLVLRYDECDLSGLLSKKNWSNVVKQILFLLLLFKVSGILPPNIQPNLDVNVNYKWKVESPYYINSKYEEKCFEYLFNCKVNVHQQYQDQMRTWEFASRCDAGFMMNVILNFE